MIHLTTLTPPRGLRPPPWPTQTYPELVGMFSHAAGALQTDFGAWAGQWAWNHDGCPEGVSHLFFWSRDDRNQLRIQIERFAVIGDWVRLVGYSTSVPADGSQAPVWLDIVTRDEEPGQRYALVRASADYAVASSVELRVDGTFAASYEDCIFWSSAETGLTQQELFLWTSPVSGGRAFQSIALFEPRRMFARAWRTFIGWTGSVSSDSVVTSQIWTW